jgi:hypothetical protein
MEPTTSRVASVEPSSTISSSKFPKVWASTLPIDPGSWEARL